MTSRFMLIFAAISGFVFVALGAFGAHVLSRTLGAAEMAWIHTGLEYQAFHTLAIFGLAVAMQRRISIWFYWSSVFMALGTAGRRRELPRRLGFNVNWCNSSET